MERAAFPWLAVQPQGAAMQDHQVTRDRKSQANSTCNASIIFNGHERLKDVLLLPGRNAEAGIADPEVHVRRRNLRPERDLSALGEFTRIAQQVEEDLAQ